MDIRLKPGQTSTEAGVRGTLEKDQCSFFFSCCFFSFFFFFKKKDRSDLDGLILPILHQLPERCATTLAFWLTPKGCQS